MACEKSLSARVARPPIEIFHTRLPAYNLSLRKIDPLKHFQLSACILNTQEKLRKTVSRSSMEVGVGALRTDLPARPAFHSWVMKESPRVIAATAKVLHVY